MILEDIEKLIGLDTGIDARPTVRSGEESLMIHSLVLAAYDLARSNQQNRESAEEWINSDSNDNVLDFARICEYFEIDPEDMRGRLRSMKDEDFSKYQIL